MILSRRNVKAMDRVGGANLILDWPPELPRGAPLPEDHEREASDAEKAYAERAVKPLCAPHGLVPVHVRVVNIRREVDFPREYDQFLSVTIIGHRWVHASTRVVPPDIWAAVRPT